MLWDKPKIETVIALGIACDAASIAWTAVGESAALGKVANTISSGYIAAMMIA